jgi:hypothetical protein
MHIADDVERPFRQPANQGHKRSPRRQGRVK